MAELANGRSVKYPLSSVQAYLDFKRFGVPPFPGGTRAWPADFLDEFNYVDAALKTAEQLAGGDGDDE